MTAERCLFMLPSGGEEVIAALAVLQAFVASRGKTAFELLLHFRNSPFDFVIEQWPVPMTVVPDAWPLLGTDLDLCFSFSSTRAQQLAKSSDKHMVQAFGLQLGVAVRTLPDVSFLLPAPSPLSGPVEVLSLLTEDLDDSVAAAVAVDPVLHRNVSSIFAQHVRIGAGAPPATVLAAIGNSHVVVGYRSPYTYLAAALGRAVVEIYPDDLPRTYLSKWESPLYQMVNVPSGVQRPQLAGWIASALRWQCQVYQASQKSLTPTVP